MAEQQGQSESRENELWNKVETKFGSAEIGSAEFMALYDFTDLLFAESVESGEEGRLSLAMVENRIDMRRSEIKGYALAKNELQEIYYSYIEGKEGDEKDKSQKIFRVALEELRSRILYPQKGSTTES